MKNIFQRVPKIHFGETRLECFFLEAQRGTLNLSKAVRLLARCLFNEDELVVESIKDLDQHKVDLLHAETTKWYNCTMTEVRQGKLRGLPAQFNLSQLCHSAFLKFGRRNAPRTGESVRRSSRTAILRSCLACRQCSTSLTSCPNQLTSSLNNPNHRRIVQLSKIRKYNFRI